MAKYFFSLQLLFDPYSPSNLLTITELLQRSTQSKTLKRNLLQHDFQQLQDG
jgi:hypothetical protein